MKTKKNKSEKEKKNAVQSALPRSLACSQCPTHRVLSQHTNPTSETAETETAVFASDLGPAVVLFTAQYRARVK
jgi:hypothetical protein